jgi:uncharacterized protein (DUF2236 family)
VLLHIPVPLSRQPGLLVHNLLMIGSLPPAIRDQYHLRWTPAHAIAYRAAVETVRRTRPLVPASARRGSCKPQFDLVAATERSRLARGRPIRGALA